jgi:glycosyltransferase involved in cell wall biosynthesis
VVALWPAAADALSQRHRVPRRDIRVIPNGVPARRFPPVDAGGRAAARQRLGVAPDAPVALYLGALIPDKDPQAAVDAVAATTGLQLLVAGDGPERARVEEHARRALPGRAHWLGAVSDPAAVLAAADVLVLPSRTEGMPAAAIEAGMSGLPVVATDVGAVREVVLDGETGVVVAPGDTVALARGLERALASRDTMGGRAREHCLARFEIGVVSDAWEELLRELEHGDRSAPR